MYHSHQNNSISHSHKIHVHQKLLTLKPKTYTFNPSRFTGSAKIRYFYQSSMGHQSIFLFAMPKGLCLDHERFVFLFLVSRNILEEEHIAKVFAEIMPMSLSYVCRMWQCMCTYTLKQVPKTVRVKLQINILNDRLVGGAFMFVCRFCL